MYKIHKQIQTRRKNLNLLQKDMEKLIGMKQAQYQKIEAGGNIKLKTLERVLKVLKLQIVLIPTEELSLVMPFLDLDKTKNVQDTDDPFSILEKFQVLDDE
ncbi:MAG: helix-turn-helix transcriptional regulator [Candidatus Cloacimonadota bacterium]|nr:helix-turn-helix transcriptional regulator [Candidatus Cloacimonadota bacterium]